MHKNPANLRARVADVIASARLDQRPVQAYVEHIEGAEDGPRWAVMIRCGGESHFLRFYSSHGKASELARHWEREIEQGRLDFQAHVKSSYLIDASGKRLLHAQTPDVRDYSRFERRKVSRGSLVFVRMVRGSPCVQLRRAYLPVAKVWELLTSDGVDRTWKDEPSSAIGIYLEGAKPERRVTSVWLKFRGWLRERPTD